MKGDDDLPEYVKINRAETARGPMAPHTLHAYRMALASEQVVMERRRLERSNGEAE